MKLPESFKPGIKGPEQARRVPVRVSKESLVKTAPLYPGHHIPVVVEPVVAKMDFVAWAAESQGMIDSLLMEHRALLFRGFNPLGVTEFGQVVKICSTGNLLEYKDRSSPRHTVGDKIYTSTDYPANQTIFLHNEGTYWMSWPLKIFFYCATASSRGGETPIADCRRIADQLDQEIKNRFIEKQILYVRNYNDGFGLTWQDVFQTSDRAAVEDHCRKNSIQFEWKQENRLRTRAVRPAISTHPRTGEMMWFNHATFFHVTTLEPAIREALLAEFKEEDLPYNTYYGDGSQIEPQVLEQLREAYRQEKISFPWQEGDLLLLDNMSVAHGRAPYEGAREVLVGMADPYTRTDL
jgi:alpha-ketoglutarate-dependent taurine dioxygenase